MATTNPAQHQPAPPLQISQWFNTDQPITLESLRGRVVVLHAFQMLCPGCVSHGLPQAQRILSEFLPRDVAVIGLHTVFEHHAAMTPTSLAAFLHEYQIHFPVGVDMASPDGPIPKTMAAYGLRGTPSLVLIGRNGAIRHHFFGRPSDLHVGAAIAELRAELPTRGLGDVVPGATRGESGQTESCDDTGCRV